MRDVAICRESIDQTREDQRRVPGARDKDQCWLGHCCSEGRVGILNEIECTEFYVCCAKVIRQRIEDFVQPNKQISTHLSVNKMTDPSSGPKTFKSFNSYAVTSRLI